MRRTFDTNRVSFMKKRNSNSHDSVFEPCFFGRRSAVFYTVSLSPECRRYSESVLADERSAAGEEGMQDA